MKLLPDKFMLNRVRRTARLGFTLAEVMITMAVFTLVILAMVTVQIFGLKVYNLSSTKLIASTAGRQMLDKIRDPIRAANYVYVGIYSNSFSAIPDGSLQVGNAIQICSPSNSVNANPCVIFYQNSASNTICFIDTNGVSTPPTVVAENITNNLCFQAEDLNGNVLTSAYKQNNPVIHATLCFIQSEFSTGGGEAYDFYYLETRVTPRSKQ